MELITRLEEAILIAVLNLEGDAYGVPINRTVSRLLNKNYTLGGLYFALDQLVRKDYLAKWKADPTQKRGGRSRICYRITPEGREALKAARQHEAKLWKTVRKFSI